ncbi:MurR/RpiR family transcriptional regulator [Rhodovarius crocodyli]|uniref:MurR/RpiR family transcriptional regulator n=1 Tax=Rhodovarius crocodyli TaxID=1979269 RepID=A0A437MDT5_9PROT|nr:MurR/RpiR family transcriptional regulator [Rhodovarius crocodyli]RVT95770.1 MurR/RpiR family transcriptional regulator [Rhodovarius crocodyli]
MIAPLDTLRRALPGLPPRLRAAGDYVARHDFDATTRSMRELAQAAGTHPATFTRLAQALGYSGWDALRDALIEARRPGPYTRRATTPGMAPLPAAILAADAQSIAAMAPGPIAPAARALHEAPRIWVAGFRSCRGVAQILHYQLRLFRPDAVRLVGGAGPDDLDLGAFRAGDAVVAVSFAPYSQSILRTARAARQAGCVLIALLDSAASPVAAGAAHVLCFEAAAGPGFFPSLTGALATAQALAAASFAEGGDAALLALREAEQRLSALSEYVPEQEPPS